MNILDPVLPGSEKGNEKTYEELSVLKGLLRELRKKEIPSEIASFINQEIELLNAFEGSGKSLTSVIRKCKNSILRISTAELGYYPKNYHKNMWLVLGMAVFGLPLGAVLGLALDNLALLGIGLPLGLALGMIFGSILDRRVRMRACILNVDVY